VKFLFEEIGAAVSVAQVLGGITAGFDLEADGAALERSLNSGDALAMRVIKTFGDAQDGGEAASHAFVEIGE